MLKSGCSEPPPFTDLVRKTHARPDGTFIDKRAEEIVTVVENSVPQQSTSDASPGTATSTVAPTLTSRTNALNAAYLDRVQPNKGRIYGLGSSQYREFAPGESVHSQIGQSIEASMRISTLEGQVSTLVTVQNLLQSQVSNLLTGQNLLLQHFGYPNPADTAASVPPPSQPTTQNQPLLPQNNSPERQHEQAQEDQPREPRLGDIDFLFD